MEVTQILLLEEVTHSFILAMVGVLEAAVVVHFADQSGQMEAAEAVSFLELAEQEELLALNQVFVEMEVLVGQVVVLVPTHKIVVIAMVAEEVLLVAEAGVLVEVMVSKERHMVPLVVLLLQAHQEH